jgi:hypothetical protein
VVDVKTSAGMLEGMSPDGFSGFDRGSDVRRGRTGVAERCEMLAVVGQHRVNDRNQAAEEIGRCAAHDLFMHFDKSELGRAVDRDKQVELALYRPTIFWPL